MHRHLDCPTWGALAFAHQCWLLQNASHHPRTANKYGTISKTAKPMPAAVEGQRAGIRVAGQGIGKPMGTARGPQSSIW